MRLRETSNFVLVLAFLCKVVGLALVTVVCFFLKHEASDLKPIKFKIETGQASRVSRGMRHFMGVGHKKTRSRKEVLMQVGDSKVFHDVNTDTCSLFALKRIVGEKTQDTTTSGCWE